VSASAIGYRRLTIGYQRGALIALMTFEPKLVRWARTIQATAQTGLHFSESDYDRDRYEKLLNLAAEMFAEQSAAKPAQILELFSMQSGYATPKVDVRGAVFQAEKVLLVRERSDGLWTLPGGWADVNNTPSEAIEREILEESGFVSKAERLLAVFDRSRHAHQPQFPFHVYKFYFLCRLISGEPTANQEISEIDFFAENNLPPLSTGRTTQEQILFCFQEHRHPTGVTRFD
jgi:ADP-ribose pyrophosphatase YjhB (NUDIX family)